MLKKLGIVEILLFNGSRKVAWAVWLGAIGCFCYFSHQNGFDVVIFERFLMASGVVLTGGTIHDKWHERKLANEKPEAAAVVAS